MTELPDELRALLDMTRDAHDPTDPNARTRVRQAVAASLLLAGAASTSVFPVAAASNTQTLGGALKAGKAGWALFGGKLTTVAVGAVTAAGLTFAAYSYSRPAVVPQAAERNRAAVVAAPSATGALSAPVVTLAPVAEAVPAPVPTAAEPAAAAAPAAPRAAQAQASAQTLSAEMAVLRTASDALARGDETAALAQLREYGRRFPNGSLREERDGLRAIAECTRDQAPSNASAKRFTRLYPSSLLGARVAKACAGL